MKKPLKNLAHSGNLYHYIFHTPLGYCAIIYQESPYGLINTLLPLKNKKQLIEKIPSDSIEAHDPKGKSLKIIDIVENYFKGRPIKISFKDLCLDHLTELQQSVLKAVYAIPFGQTRSYGDIAKAVGRPKAARFVGTTMANNPFPLLIPCHRVIKSDGAFGKFGGGTDQKARLIWHEKKMGDG